MAQVNFLTSRDIQPFFIFYKNLTPTFVSQIDTKNPLFLIEGGAMSRINHIMRINWIHSLLDCVVYMQGCFPLLPYFPI